MPDDRYAPIPGDVRALSICRTSVDYVNRSARRGGGSAADKIYCFHTRDRFAFGVSALKEGMNNPAIGL